MNGISWEVRLSFIATEVSRALPPREESHPAGRASAKLDHIVTKCIRQTQPRTLKTASNNLFIVPFFVEFGFKVFWIMFFWMMLILVFLLHVILTY